ncbi:MAG: NAD-dependent epimerase/dehydratase family protein [Candidatus Aenigmarchaeota archaeon]|nr:NAD-dependent epimerase/dehydratase family protein [Candidatus Aenigmarchaeota archaeon]
MQLVTGSSGMIGTAYSEKILLAGENFLGIDLRKNSFVPELNKKTLIANLLERDFGKAVSNDIDIIIHLAANARVYNLVKNPALAMDNCITAFNIFEFARRHDISRIVLASSREVYGEGGYPRKESDADFQRCENPYAASKILSESLATSYCKCYGISYIILRFSNVYGKYDISDRFVPLTIRRAIKNEPIVIYGSKVLDFTYIGDAVQGIMKAMQNFSQAKNDAYNIASGTGTKLTDVAKIVTGQLNSKSPVTVDKNREGEIMSFVADTGKARAQLSYKPEISIKEGLRMSVEWYRQNL